MALHKHKPKTKGKTKVSTPKKKSNLAPPFEKKKKKGK